MEFTVELGGVPVGIRCRFAENRDFLKDYLTDREPAVTVAPAAEDLLRMREGMERMARNRGYRYDRIADSYLENQALHEGIAEALVSRDVLVLHGSALSMDGRAVVFAAPSGTGKSTQARLWREAFGERVQMINDDKPLIRIDPEAVTVWGSPWDGKHHLSRNASAPLRAVLEVRRSDENRLVPMKAADAFQLLTRQCYASAGAETMRRILRLEKELTERAPFFRLYCNMDAEAARTAWEGVKDR